MAKRGTAISHTVMPVLWRHYRIAVLFSVTAWAGEQPKTERILFLKGEVNLVAAAEVQKIHEVADMLELAREMEEHSALDYNRWVNECGTNADSASKKLFEDLAADEERHYNQYDGERDNMAKFGDKYPGPSIHRTGRTAIGGTSRGVVSVRMGRTADGGHMQRRWRSCPDTNVPSAAMYTTTIRKG